MDKIVDVYAFTIYIISANMPPSVPVTLPSTSAGGSPSGSAPRGAARASTSSSAASGAVPAPPSGEEGGRKKLSRSNPSCS